MPNKDKKWRNEAAKMKITSDEPEIRGRAFYYGHQRFQENEKAKFVHDHFDRVAGKYDFMNTLMSFGTHHQWKKRAVRLLKLDEGDRVIDVCGGTGDLSILAAGPIGSSGRVILYDVNRAMLERGRRKTAKIYCGKSIFTVQGDAERISFPDGHFDAAMVGFGIRNLTHMEKGFSEMHRVLKPGGKLMCLEFSKPTPPLFRRLYDFYSFQIMPWLGWAIVGSREAYTYLPQSIRTFASPDELTRMLEGIGFSNVCYLRLTNGIAVIHLASKG